MQVLPFADTQPVQELVATHLAELAPAQLLPLLAQVRPQLQVGQEVGVLHVEARVLLVGGLLELGGAFPDVLDRQCRDDDQHLVQAPVAVRLDEHPGHPRIDRELGEFAAGGGELRAGRDRSVTLRGLLAAAIAPSSSSSAMPSRIARGSGFSTNGNASMSPSPSAVICSTTDARLVRRISGSVNWGRASKSSSEYNRMQMPSATRPQRPARWRADACEIGSMGRRCTLVRTE